MGLGAFGRVVLGLAAMGSVLVVRGRAQDAATPAAAAKPAAQSCAVARGIVPSEADKALEEGHYAEAEKLYAAMPKSSAATVGVLRAQLGQRKLKEALALAMKESAAAPNDPVLLDGLGEVRFRRGETDEAAQAYNRSRALDSCSARTYYDMGRYNNLRGYGKRAQALLDLAHRLSPEDPEISRAYRQTHRVQPTVEERMERVKEREAKPDLTDARKAELEAELKRLEVRGKGDCELATQTEATKLAMQPLGNFAVAGDNQGVGLDVYLNGKRKRLELDTGASGLLLFSDGAKALGLTTEAQSSTYGVGDSGTRDTLVTHVDSIKVGQMEFHNCVVRVIPQRNVMNGLDGLIGGDVFRSFLVSLDFPAMEVRLGPLPKRPDEAVQTASLGTESEDSDGVSLADTRRDPYVAPEMNNWTPVFRSNHMLIVPTAIGKAPIKLFLLDSGAGISSISPEAAREVTGVGSDSSITVTGISGEVKNVMSTGMMSVTFAGVRQLGNMIAFDTSGLSRGVGAEISGIIGYPILRQVTFQIDYRDNLVHVDYKPHIDR